MQPVQWVQPVQRVQSVQLVHLEQPEQSKQSMQRVQPKQSMQWEHPIKLKSEILAFSSLPQLRIDARLPLLSITHPLSTRNFDPDFDPDFILILLFQPTSFSLRAL